MLTNRLFSGSRASISQTKLKRSHTKKLTKSKIFTRNYSTIKNTNKKDVSLHSKLYKAHISEHLQTAKGFDKFKKGNLIATPVKQRSKEEIKNYTEGLIASRLIDFVSDNYKFKGPIGSRADTLNLAGTPIPKNILHVALNKDANRETMALLGKLLKAAGYSADDFPTLLPFCFYGSLEEAYVANTPGLRMEDIGLAREAAKELLNDLKEKFPGCKFAFRANALDVTMDGSHPTMGRVFNKRKEGPSSRFGQAMHVQTQIVLITKEGEEIDLFTGESTGAANHPTGENAENRAHSFNAGHRAHPTDDFPVRKMSKDGELDLSQLTPDMEEVQEQNTNSLNAQKGSKAQQPDGLRYKRDRSIQVGLTGDALEKTLAQFLLMQKGGQIIYDDKLVPNPNPRHAEQVPEVRRVLTAGTLGQHGQGGGLLMCASTALEQLFGQDGVLADSDYQKPNTTNEVMLSLFLHAMTNPEVDILDSEGNVIPEDAYEEAVIGWQAIDAHRTDFIKEHEQQKASGAIPPDSALPETFTVERDGVSMTFPTQKPIGPANDPKKNLSPYLLAIREMGNRYTRKQQLTDFGAYIDTPTTPEEKMASISAIFQFQLTYERLSDDDIERLLAVTQYSMEELEGNDTTSAWLATLSEKRLDMVSRNAQTVQNFILPEFALPDSLKRPLD